MHKKNLFIDDPLEPAQRTLFNQGFTLHFSPIRLFAPFGGPILKVHLDASQPCLFGQSL